MSAASGSVGFYVVLVEKVRSTLSTNTTPISKEPREQERDTMDKML